VFALLEVAVLLVRLFCPPLLDKLPEPPPELIDRNLKLAGERFELGGRRVEERHKQNATSLAEYVKSNV